MKKVVAIYYKDKNERDSEYKDGFVFKLDDGTTIETCSTDVIAHDVIKTKEN